jgi:hypothetical protein
VGSEWCEWQEGGKRGDERQLPENVTITPLWTGLS